VVSLGLVLADGALVSCALRNLTRGLPPLPHHTVPRLTQMSNLPAFRSMNALLLESKKNLNFMSHVLTFYDYCIGPGIAQSV